MRLLPFVLVIALLVPVGRAQALSREEMGHRLSHICNTLRTGSDLKTNTFTRRSLRRFFHRAYLLGRDFMRKIYPLPPDPEIHDLYVRYLRAAQRSVDAAYRFQVGLSRHPLSARLLRSYAKPNLRYQRLALKLGATGCVTHR